MEIPQGHRVVSDSSTGCFRLLCCSCGRHTLFVGKTVIRLEPRQFKDLAGLFKDMPETPPAVTGTEAGVEGMLTSAVNHGMLSRFTPFSLPESDSGGCN